MKGTSNRSGKIFSSRCCTRCGKRDHPFVGSCGDEEKQSRALIQCRCAMTGAHPIASFIDKNFTSRSKERTMHIFAGALSADRMDPDASPIALWISSAYEATAHSPKILHLRPFHNFCGQLVDCPVYAAF